MCGQISQGHFSSLNKLLNDFHHIVQFVPFVGHSLVLLTDIRWLPRGRWNGFDKFNVHGAAISCNNRAPFDLTQLLDFIVFRFIPASELVFHHSRQRLAERTRFLQDNFPFAQDLGIVLELQSIVL